LDWHVFAYLLAVCVLTGIGFGLAPAIASARADLQRGLKESSGRGITGIGGLRDGLVVAEIALAFVLLIGAGLLLRAFLRLQATPTGLVAENVLTLHITGGADARRYGEIEQRIEEIPGVSAAGLTQFLPLQNWDWLAHFTIAGRPAEIPSRLPVAELRYVTPGYFRALGIPLRKGRGLTGRDTPDAPRVVLINEALARRYFPNENPVGRQTDRGTVVGVVGDVRQAGLDRPPVPEIYYPVAQNVAQTDSGMVVVVSAKLPPERLVSAVRAAIHEVDPGQTVFNIKAMQRVIADSMSDFELYLWLIGLFAALAVTLAAAGIYGVVSYTATLRTHELGIRMALGAAAGDVLRLILRRTLLLAGGGILLGAAGALAATRVLAKLLFEVKPTDPATFASVAALIACMALMAALLPARRASKVDPVEALRYE
jgi:predicted permease